ncbi:MAG: P-loop ATPase, Sll1717 family [Gammaproteobacteria bacterium]
MIVALSGTRWGICMASSEFVFYRNDDIGSAAAEDDDSYLKECFVDTGDLEALLDCSNPRRVVVGRTGSGKSALIARLLESAERKASLSPHSLALNFIANNDVIGFFEAAGVNLNPFYVLLWRHLLVVELLQLKFNLSKTGAKVPNARFFEGLLTKKDRNKELAIEYLTQWGDKFWLTAEERVHELVSKIQGSLTASLDGTQLNVPINIGGARSLTREQRAIVEQRGRHAVSGVQIRELDNIVHVLAEDVFSDPYKRHYITIDTLDEDWVIDRIKLQLVKALLDCVRKFQEIRCVKVVVAMRLDLLDRVLHVTRSPGFQEEKYE